MGDWNIPKNYLDQSAKVGRLEKRIAELEARHDNFLKEFWKTNADNERLRAALIKHGVHSEACVSRDLSDRGISFVRHDWPCDCGLRAALREDEDGN